MKVYKLQEIAFFVYCSPGVCPVFTFYCGFTEELFHYLAKLKLLNRTCIMNTNTNDKNSKNRIFCEGMADVSLPNSSCCFRMTSWSNYCRLVCRNKRDPTCVPCCYVPSCHATSIYRLLSSLRLFELYICSSYLLFKLLLLDSFVSRWKKIINSLLSRLWQLASR